MEYSGPEIRILREISSPEPAGNVISPQSRPKSGQINFLMCFFLNLKNARFRRFLTPPGHFQPVLGRKFCVESEFRHQNTPVRRPGAKI